MKYWDWLSPFAVPLFHETLPPPAPSGFVSVPQALCNQPNAGLNISVPRRLALLGP